MLAEALDGSSVSEADCWVLGWLVKEDANCVAAVAELIATARCRMMSLCPACAGDVISGRPPAELPASVTTAPGRWPPPPDSSVPGEVRVLAGLLAEVVELAADRAVFPGRLEHIAERAMERYCVRRALCELVREQQ